MPNPKFQTRQISGSPPYNVNMAENLHFFEITPFYTMMEYFLDKFKSIHVFKVHTIA